MVMKWRADCHDYEEYQTIWYDLLGPADAAAAAAAVVIATQNKSRFCLL